MVTVQEFQAACELARKRIAQLDWYWFGIAALAIGGLVALAYAQYGLVEHPLGIDLELRRARLGLRILGGGVILLSLNLAYRLWRVPRTQPGAHSCSHCQTRLFELMHEAIVVASRHCVGCGVKHLGGSDPRR